MTEERWADSETEATQTVEDGMAALNSGDDEALFDTFHMPPRADIRHRRRGLLRHSGRSGGELSARIRCQGRGFLASHGPILNPSAPQLRKQSPSVHPVDSIRQGRWAASHPPSLVDHDQARRPLGCSGAFQLRPVRAPLGKLAACYPRTRVDCF